MMQIRTPPPAPRRPCPRLSTSAARAALKEEEEEEEGARLLQALGLGQRTGRACRVVAAGEAPGQPGPRVYQGSADSAALAKGPRGSARGRAEGQEMEFKAHSRRQRRGCRPPQDRSAPPSSE